MLATEASGLLESRDSEGWGDELEWEDDKERPSSYSKQFLHGRALSASSTEGFNVAWCYERLVNKVMHFCTTPEHPWYQVNVEGGELDMSGMARAVHFAFVVMSPVVFPLFFSCVLFAMTVLSPFTWRPILTMKRTRLELLERVTRGSEDFAELPAEGRRFSPFAVLGTVVESFLFTWLGLLPWFYIFRGHYSCDTDPQCEDSKFHISPMVVFHPWLACGMASWRFTRGITVSDCDCEVDAQQRVSLGDKRYGAALRKIIQKLGDYKDPASYFPIILEENQDDPGTHIKKRVHFAIMLVSLAHTLLPLLWYAGVHKEPLLPIHSGWLPLFAASTSILLVSREIYFFLISFHSAIEEFRRVVDELFIFTYIGSRSTSKQRPAFRHRYKQTVQLNDQDRSKYRDFFMSQLKLTDHTQLGDFNGRTRFDKHHKGSRLDLTELVGRTDELQHLNVYQVAFNFTTKEGVLLFRKMRTWICVDIINERLEVEEFLNMATAFLVVSVTLLFLAYLEVRDHLITMAVVLPFDMTVLSVFVLRAVNMCAVANEYMFDGFERVLLEWEENTVDDRAAFAVKHQAIGWIWNEQTGEVEALPLPKGDTIHSGPEQVATTLALVRKMSSTLETKQRILGFEVTKQLRNRLFVSGASVLGAAVSKIPWGLVFTMYEDMQHSVLARVG